MGDQDCPDFLKVGFGTRRSYIAPVVTRPCPIPPFPDKVSRFMTEFSQDALCIWAPPGPNAQ